MSDNDIIKALECCQTKYNKNCDKCAYEFHKTSCINYITCDTILRSDVLSLINRQKAEIERLKKTAYIMSTRGGGKTSLLLDRICDIRTEAIRDVVERLKDYVGDSLYFEIETDYFKAYLDSLVKEMCGIEYDFC